MKEIQERSSWREKKGRAPLPPRYRDTCHSDPWLLCLPLIFRLISREYLCQNTQCPGQSNGHFDGIPNKIIAGGQWLVAR